MEGIAKTRFPQKTFIADSRVDFRCFLEALGAAFLSLSGGEHFCNRNSREAARSALLMLRILRFPRTRQIRIINIADLAGLEARRIRIINIADPAGQDPQY